MRAVTLSVLALAGLGACARTGAPLTFEQTPLVATRAFAAAFQDQPFDAGPVTVLTSEHGGLASYTLSPCRGGETVCQGGTFGRAGTLQVTPDYAVITGLYNGRTFYLSPGGDGWVKHHGVLTPLAWEDDEPLTFWAVTATSDQGIDIAETD